jgi:hypothetical protein
MMEGCNALEAVLKFLRLAFQHEITFPFACSIPEWIMAETNF